MKQQKLEKLILETIDRTSSIMPLYKMHYSIFLVMQVCRELEKRGFITYSDERRILTKEGKKYLGGIKKQPFDIEPFDEYRTEKLNVDDIYLP